MKGLDLCILAWYGLLDRRCLAFRYWLASRVGDDGFTDLGNWIPRCGVGHRGEAARENASGGPYGCAEEGSASIQARVYAIGRRKHTSLPRSQTSKNARGCHCGMGVVGWSEDGEVVSCFLNVRLFPGVIERV